MNSRIPGKIVVAFGGALSILLSGCAGTSPFRDQADQAILSWAGQENGSAVIYTLSEVPLNVRNHFGEIADRDGRFNPGCVWREGVPGKRFLVAAHNEDIWRVTVEEGGFACQWYFTDFTLNSSGEVVEARRIAPNLLMMGGD